MTDTICFIFFFFFIWLCQVLAVAYGLFDLHCSMWDLVPRQGIKPGPPTLRVQYLNHWTTREDPFPARSIFLINLIHLTGGKERSLLNKVARSLESVPL